MLVGVLISIMISIVVGVSLVPTIVQSIDTTKHTGQVWTNLGNETDPNWTWNGTATVPAGLSGLLDVLVYVFVAVILLGAVAWIGGQA